MGTLEYLGKKFVVSVIDIKGVLPKINYWVIDVLKLYVKKKMMEQKEEQQQHRPASILCLDCLSYFV